MSGALSGQRFTALDSLRGIAALIVLFTHCYAAWPTEARDQLFWLNHTPLRLLINGNGAVTFFFVLSGFVLALPFLQKRQPTYWSFIARRWCRIYLPFIVSIFLAWGLHGWVGGQAVANTSNWFFFDWATNFGWREIGRHLMLTGLDADMRLNSSIWTIIIELRAAMIFPLLVWLCGDSKRGMIAALLCYVGSTGALLLMRPEVDEFLMNTDNFWAGLLITVRFLAFFIVGILLAKHHTFIQEQWDKLPRVIRWGIAAGGVFCLLLPHFLLEHAAQGVGAALVIVLATRRGVFQHILGWKPLQWLGHISFSLYLVHVPVLLATFHLLLGSLSFASCVVVALIAALTLATLMHHLVENPAIRLGRRIPANIRLSEKCTALAGQFGQGG